MNAYSAFVSALFWVRIVRISSEVGSQRRPYSGRPYTPASPSRANWVTPGRVRSRRFAHARYGFGFRRFGFALARAFGLCFAVAFGVIPLVGVTCAWCR